MYIKTYIGLFLLQLQTVHSRAGNRYTYTKSKSKNITTSTNASRDLLTTQATTTIMSTNLFTTSMQMPLPPPTTVTGIAQLNAFSCAKY